MIVLALGAIVASATAGAQTQTEDDWTGIWHADVDGQPTGTLTLATDTGSLGGTVVLDIISDEGGRPHVIASEPHVLMNPHVEANTLSFDVKMRRKNGSIVVASFRVAHTAPDKATIHCVNCGKHAPVVQLARGQ